MPTRIRLQRKGKKNRPYYHIVIADSRSPRDGRYIERIGAYDPNQVPAFVELNFDRALEWYRKGAQPSDTCKAILSYRGVLYMDHLMRGVSKGAFNEEEAQRRFDMWLNEKNTKIEGKRKSVEEQAAKAEADRVAAETKKAADMAAALSAKLAQEGAAEAAAEEAAAEAALRRLPPPKKLRPLKPPPRRLLPPKPLLKRHRPPRRSPPKMAGRKRRTDPCDHHHTEGLHPRMRAFFIPIRSTR